MNKIHIIETQVEIKEQDSNLKLDIIKPYSEFDILKIKIVVQKSTQLELYKFGNQKIDIAFVMEENVQFQLFEICECHQLKAQNTYDLESNSQVEVIKFISSKQVKELDLIRLNGENASIEHKMKTIACDQQRFDIISYHNASQTTSKIRNHGVTIQEGTISFQATSVVYSGMKGCILDQNNRIIMMNHLRSNINPVLLIEENDVIANHSAFIGKFKEDTIFYLMSRGISRDTALQLLIKGFLLESVPKTESILKLIEQYWG